MHTHWAQQGILRGITTSTVKSPSRTWETLEARLRTTEFFADKLKKVLPGYGMAAVELIPGGTAINAAGLAGIRTGIHLRRILRRRYGPGVSGLANAALTATPGEAAGIAAEAAGSGLRDSRAFLRKTVRNLPRPISRALNKRVFSALRVDTGTYLMSRRQNEDQPQGFDRWLRRASYAAAPVVAAGSIAAYLHTRRRLMLAASLKAKRAPTPFTGRTVEIEGRQLAARTRLMHFACSPEENLYLRERLRKQREQIRLRGHLRIFHFGGREQMKDIDDNTWANPAAAAMGTQRVYIRKDKEGNPVPMDVTLRHAQVGRYVWNQAARAERPMRRGYVLGRDLKDVVAGNPRRTDSRGRPRPREWEKAWFKRTLGIAGVAAAGMGGLAYLKQFPHQGPKVPFTTKRMPSRDAVLGQYDKLKDKVNAITPDFFPKRRMGFAARLREILLDFTGGDWDVRDARGRSARVFAGGGSPRDRRPKYWWEKTRNQRIMAAVAAPAILAAGFAGGRYLKDRPLKSLSPFRNPFAKPPPGVDGNPLRNTPPPVRRRVEFASPGPVGGAARADSAPRSFREVLLDYATAEP
jgi:hypothetical protein